MQNAQLPGWKGILGLLFKLVTPKYSKHTLMFMGNCKIWCVGKADQLIAYTLYWQNKTYPVHF